jgi:hypothetical protein
VLDLAAAKQKRDSGLIQHIVVSGHYPLYSDTQWTNAITVRHSARMFLHEKNLTSAFFQTIEPIMIRYGVDVYICGHGNCSNECREVTAYQSLV